MSGPSYWGSSPVAIWGADLTRGNQVTVSTSQRLEVHRLSAKKQTRGGLMVLRLKNLLSSLLDVRVVSQIQTNVRRTGSSCSSLTSSLPCLQLSHICATARLLLLIFWNKRSVYLTINCSIWIFVTICCKSWKRFFFHTSGDLWETYSKNNTHLTEMTIGFYISFLSQ